MYKKNIFFALFFLTSFLISLSATVYKGFIVNENQQSLSAKNKSTVSLYTDLTDQETNDLLLEDNEDENESKIDSYLTFVNYPSTFFFNIKNRVTLLVSLKTHGAFLPTEICLLGHNFRI